MADHMTAEQLQAELTEKIEVVRARSAAMEALGDDETAAILEDHAEYLCTVAARLSGMAAAVHDGWKLVPIVATEDQLTGLARDIVMWSRFPAPHYGSALHWHLEMVGREIPAWLLEMIPNIDHTPPKGAVAEAIYRAMLDESPEPPHV